MSEYRVELLWLRGDDAFVDRRYSRRHTLRFDGGAEWAASSSPQVVRAPYSDPAAVDPEEAFVAALSSCHALWFLDIACRRGFRVDRYTDTAVGRMSPNTAGKLFMSHVTLRPAVLFSGERTPDQAELDAMHHEAHEECFIANSVNSEIRIDATFIEA